MHLKFKTLETISCLAARTRWEGVSSVDYTALSSTEEALKLINKGKRFSSENAHHQPMKEISPGTAQVIERNLQSRMP